MRKKTKWSFIENDLTRKTTFRKRKKGMMKKLNELTTLCDVKACAVVHNPKDLSTEVWPSNEGVDEVVSSFLELSVEEQTKKMVNQTDFIRQRIAKEEDKLQKLRDENRDIEIQNFIFSCMEGEMDVHQLDEKKLRDMLDGVDKYLDKLNRRKEMLDGEGSSSSAIPSHVVADAGAAAPVGLYDGMIQCHNQNEEQPTSVQLQYSTLFDFYNQIPEKIHGFNMSVNSKKSMLLDLNQKLDAGEDEDIPSMDNV